MNAVERGNERLLRKSYLGIIPARGGSKGIKDKNIADVAGRPLLHYTSSSALRALAEGMLHQLVLSTDSELIRRVGLDEGLDVPFLRPATISGDQAKSISFVEHALDHFLGKGIAFDAVVILQPTSPFRAYDDLKDAILLFDRCDDESLVSCYHDESVNLSNIYTLAMDGMRGVPVAKDHGEGKRRQDLQRLLIRNGAMFITDVEYLRRERRLISDAPLIYEMPRSRSMNIDTEDDLLEARRRMGC